MKELISITKCLEKLIYLVKQRPINIKK